MNRIFLTLLFMVLPLGLSASSNDDLSKSKGTDQDVIVSLAPSPAQTDVSRHAKIEAVFAVPLEASLVKKHDVKLTLLSTKNHDGKPTFLFTKKHKHIKGKISYDDAEHKVTFAPNKPLEPGMYEVEIKSIKADKAHKREKIKEIKYRFIVVKELLHSIAIIPDTIDVKEGTNVQLQAIGHYDSGKDQNITSLVNWSVANTDTAAVDSNATVTAIKEGATTLKAALNNMEGNASVVVYNEIDGHRLPPEPDMTINNSTLLGIDINDDGVRDDVERYIYGRFAGFKNAKIDRAIAIQYARAAQIIIQGPETAYDRKTYVYMHNVIDCAWFYYQKSSASFKELLEYRQDHKIFDDLLEDRIFNTRERLEAYMKYNDSLSGHMFDSRPRTKEKCDFDFETLWTE